MPRSSMMKHPTSKLRTRHACLQLRNGRPCGSCDKQVATWQPSVSECHHACQLCISMTHDRDYRFSDKYPFRMRSETPDIAIELSLQPWRAFKTDGVVFFSDILTPLPALGIEFDVIKGKGPQVSGSVF